MERTQEVYSRARLLALEAFLDKYPGFKKDLYEYFIHNGDKENLITISLDIGKASGRTAELVVISGIKLPEEILKREAKGHPAYFSEERYIHRLSPGTGVGFDEEGSLYFPKSLYEDMSAKDF